jgi:predicted homoserine dehydrogenase-like protein
MWSLINEMMEKRHKSGRPIRVAIAGMGYIGKGLASHIGKTKGMHLAAVYARNPGKAAATLSQVSPKVCTTFVANREQLSSIELDVIVDCTGDPFCGAQLAVQALEAGLHFIASPETDATVGPILASMFRERGTVYSGAYGDEPGLIKELFDYVSFLGFEVVAAGKFKNYHNPCATPSTVKPWAEKSGQNPYMIASFADGSKMAMEMAITANATGLIPDIRGMHIPSASLDTVSSILSTREEGGILTRIGVVEVVRGVEPSGGVFVVGRSEDGRMREDMRYLKMGSGPNYLFYRPYHLASVEMSASIAHAVLLQRPTIAPQGKPVAGVLTVAKDELQVGTVLDNLGGYTCYGLVDRAESINKEGLLPLGLSPGARLLRRIQRDEPIALSDVELDEDTALYKLSRNEEGK